MSKIDWTNLSFSYIKTDYNVRSYFKDGQWSDLEESTSEQLSMHMAATCLHYGQQAFEGLKAFKGKDGKVRIFRMDENAKRMQHSADGILMQPVPAELFKKAVMRVVELNMDYVPPYESGATLYIRPLLIGSGPKVGVSPAEEYTFVVFVTPVGAYFKEGFKPTKQMISRKFDRAAPQGTGNLKVGGNYAASMRAGKVAHEGGYSSVLYLDSREKKYIDEAGPANFFAIKGNTYVTPLSNSILPSITNMSLIQLAKDMGLNVERRKVEMAELSEFDEVGACGTAAVISPIGQIDDIDENVSYKFGDPSEAGPICTKLYHKLRGIQYGDEPDKYGWVTIVE
ncbi:branched-chain amino acid aminotransferase [Saccharicrinis fermentans]|uniref:Branched-chain-amino-acid aminotransferase n=1 Tax=Saccharicrinis fermentans DSM 9555 = JCM 21142 TaxID=869213 RepID=W7Y5L9_9BACT|nr:branched-chain amino acid aminotransferase [Saccharicrinis fermentans]GAF03407.1 branched-chain-amino-acid aminotransferase 2 [Saccharicrinis fermentans DSM 9555 = JCM 21142]